MTKPWADQPFKLIATPKSPETDGISKEVLDIATEMALAHNLMVRNLNAIYLQADGVTDPQDIKDFILFIQFALNEIHHHHSLEEQYLFPAIAEYSGVKDIMETNIQQHHAFEVGLEKFKEYIHVATPESYDGKRVKQMINEFGQILALHLADEIPTLLGLEKYGGNKLKEAYAALEAQIMKTMGDKSAIIPVGLGANDKTFEGGKNANWPPLPFFIPILTKYYFARKYKGCWKFSPCDFNGQPKELPFATEQ